MRLIHRDPTPLEPSLKINHSRQATLAIWLQEELENALSDHLTLERSWKNSRREYYATPEHATRNVPYLNASNQVAPLAQIATDAIFATVFATILNTSPIITCKATNDKWGARAKAIQERIDHELNSEGESTSGGLHWNFLPSLYHSGKDCVKLGTGIWEVTWTEHVTKGKFTRTERSGSRCTPIPIENVIVPGGASYDLHNLPWIAIRHEWSAIQLQEEITRHNWTPHTYSPAGNISSQAQNRERFSRQPGVASRKDTYEIFKIFVNYDIDNDGETEELLVWFNLTDHQILHLDWFPYDHRNIITAHFDIEEFFFFGRGVPAILTKITKMATDALNHWNDNEYLANCRMYKGPIGAVEGDTVLAFPGRYFASSNPDLISELRMSEVYPGMAELLQVAIGFAERATGINDLTTARPAQIPGRTPATTTLQMLGQVAQRHTPFFTSFRSAAGSLVKECLYREQEQLLRGNNRLVSHLTTILGQENASLYIDALTDPEFDNAITTELTVTSAEINRQAEQQQAIALSQLYRQYVQDITNAVAIVANPQVPQPLRDVLSKAIIASNEFMERILRTFNDVSNPKTFIIDPLQEMNQLSQQATENPLSAILQTLGPFGAASSNGTSPSPT